MNASPRNTTSINIRYEAEPTLRAFHRSDAKVRGVLGPIGSGKSSACVMEIYIKACRQEPDMNGVRSTRWAIIRNTYAELITTTMVTFRKWFYEPICNYKSDRPLSARIRMPLGDGTTVDCEVLFLACDRAEDAGKFRSLEITGAWVNEASQIEKGVVDVIQGRCGRFPSKWYNQNDVEVGGPTWFGMIMDTNAPDDESWWYKCAEVEKPEGWRFFQQPPAILLAPDSTPAKPIYVPNEGQNPSIPPAENIKHIPTGWAYYMDQIAGKPYEYIKVFLMAQYGTVSYGRPVYPEYSDVIHYAPNALAKPDGTAGELTVYNGLPLFLGWDFGVQHSACVIAQLSPKGQLRVLQEILGENCGIRQFARELVVPLLRNNYNGAKIVSTGDPAGSSRASTDEQTCIQILNEEGIPTQPCSTNSPVARREAVRYFLSRMVNGEAGLLLGEKCPTIRRGFLGRYCYKRMTSTTLGEAYSGDPLKDIHSHPHDALQYIAVRIQSGDMAYTEARKFMMEREKYSGVTMPQQTAGVPSDIDMKGFF